MEKLQDLVICILLTATGIGYLFLEEEMAEIILMIYMN